MSSSEVVRNFGSVLTSVSQHQREKVAIVRNNRLEAVLLAVDVYEQMAMTCEKVKGTAGTPSEEGNGKVLLDFLHAHRLSDEARLSPDEVERQIRAEREAWD